MAPMSSADALRRDLAGYAATLHALAERSIRSGFAERAPVRVAVEDYPVVLRQQMASFVTLHRGGELRGCIGTAYAARPLVEDVAHNAFHAAFSDPRFPPLAPAEFESTDIELSLLTAPEPVAFADEEDLLARLVPGRDGLILEHRAARGLFLPQVWDMVPDRRAFLDHLKAKARLPSGPLDAGVRAQRFEAVKLAAEPATPAPAPA